MVRTLHGGVHLRGRGGGLLREGVAQGRELARHLRERRREREESR